MASRIYGWDASHYDWDRGPMDMARAVREGVTFATHKIGEGSSYTDPRFDDWYRKARAADVPLLGAYFVNHRGDQQAQADRFLSLLNKLAPGWDDGPVILQVDAERWSNASGVYAYEPRPAEVRAFCDRLVARTGGRYRPLVYAPKWVYGDTLKGLPYPLWASSYGSNPTKPFADAYPGDDSSRWAAYSGQTPAVLQYGSKTRIAGQGTCDANAFRGSLSALTALVYPKQQALEEDDMANFTDVHAATLDTLARVLPNLVAQVGYTDGRAEALASGRDTVRADLKGGGSAVWLVTYLKGLGEIIARESADPEEIRALLAELPTSEQIAEDVLAGLGQRSPADVLAALQAAGYDLADLRAELDRQTAGTAGA